MKDIITAGLMWFAASTVGVILVFLYHDNLYPVKGAEQAFIVDDAFTLLLYLTVPVVALVVVMVTYCLIRFQGKDTTTDGEPTRFNRGWAWSWLAWSTALCLFVIVTPGWTGLQELRATNSSNPDLVVEVTGIRWQWMFYYPSQNIRLNRNDDILVLPTDSLIRFKVKVPETDVLHSFWVPAFRQKIDAIPGRTTTVDVTTNRLGSYESTNDYRVQCAELCGLNHSKMSTNVKVVSKEEFRAWAANK